MNRKYNMTWLLPFFAEKSLKLQKKKNPDSREKWVSNFLANCF